MRAVVQGGAQRGRAVDELLGVDVGQGRQAEDRIAGDRPRPAQATAGRDSVAYLIATTSVALLTHPEQLAHLREDLTRVGPAVEEFMRVGAMFVTLFARTATEDVVVEDVTIPAGTSVAVSPVAANRDPSHWGGDAESFDVSRDAFGHFGFGYGIHSCIGQQVARVEIREAVTALLEAFPDLSLVDAEQLVPQPFAHPVAVYEAGTVEARLTAG